MLRYDEYIQVLREQIRELLPYVFVQDGWRLGPDASDDEATQELHRVSQELVDEEYLMPPRPDPNGAQLRALIRRMAAAQDEKTRGQLLRLAQELAAQEYDCVDS